MSNYFYNQLLESEPLGFIDPLQDLGEFDSIQMKFKEPVSQLINKYSRLPYSFHWQKKIEEMRTLYIQYQESLKSEDLKLDIHNRVRDKKEKVHLHEIVTTYLCLGFRFREIEERVSLVNTRLRRKWNRSQYVRTTEPRFYLKGKSSSGFIHSSTLPKSLRIN